MAYYFNRYCKDYQDIENYEKAKKDNFIGWHCHHRLQTWTSDGERRAVNISAAELQALGMYYNRPPEELIFLTASEHHSLHDEGENNPMYGKHHSEEARKKMSDSWDYDKHFTTETRRKMREAAKGKPKSEEHKKKIGETKKGNTYVRGRHWYNNGKENKYCYECPDGFIPGMLK